MSLATLYNLLAVQCLCVCVCGGGGGGWRVKCFNYRGDILSTVDDSLYSGEIL